MDRLQKVTKVQGLKEWTENLKKEFLSPTQAETMIQTKIAEAGHARFEQAETVPEVENAEQNVLYLVPNAESGIMDIYAKIGDTMKKLADTNIDLSGYVQKETGKELIDSTKITKLDGVAENATKVEMGTKEGTIVINGEEKTLFEVATKEDLDAVFAEVFGNTETQA